MDPREKAGALPESPGVYLFKDVTGKIIYVGKARILRNRVRSYFLESRWIDAKPVRWSAKLPISNPSS